MTGQWSDIFHPRFCKTLQALARPHLLWPKHISFSNRQRFFCDLSRIHILENCEPYARCKAVPEPPGIRSESRLENLNTKIAAAKTVKTSKSKGKDVSKILAAAADKLESREFGKARDLFVKARKDNPKKCCRGKEKPFVELGKKMKKAGHESRAIQYFNYAKDVNPSFVIPQK